MPVKTEKCIRNDEKIYVIGNYFQISIIVLLIKLFQGCRLHAKWCSLLTENGKLLKIFPFYSDMQ